MAIKTLSRKKAIRPFISKQKRFFTIGLHPNLDKQGLLVKRNPDVAPWTYNPSVIRELEKPRIELWTRELISCENREKLDKNPVIWEKRRRERENACIGDLDELCQLCYPRLKLNASNNLNFGRDIRFRERISTDVPSPGTYGKNHIPDTLYQENKGTLHSFSKLPTFERDGFAPRFKYYDSSIPPNRYCPVDQNSISVRLINKVVSLKGPYNLFTGPRDETTLNNHFSKAVCSPNTCFYEFTNDLDILLKHPIKAQNGKFKQCKRFETPPTSRFQLFCMTSIPKKGKYPGPVTYNPVFPKCRYDSKPNKYPFNCSMDDPRGRILGTVTPGPGRYKVTPSFTKHGKKYQNTWQFLSKVVRGFKPPPPYNNF